MRWVLPRSRPPESDKSPDLPPDKTLSPAWMATATQRHSTVLLMPTMTRVLCFGESGEDRWIVFLWRGMGRGKVVVMGTPRPRQPYKAWAWSSLCLALRGFCHSLTSLEPLPKSVSGGPVLNERAQFSCLSSSSAKHPPKVASWTPWESRFLPPSHNRHPLCSIADDWCLSSRWPFLTNQWLGN